MSKSRTNRDAQRLERVKSLPPPTPREKIEQKRSWVRGEMLFDGKLTEAEVDALLLNIPEFALLSELTASQAAHETDAKIAADMIAELIEQKAALREALTMAEDMLTVSKVEYEFCDSADEWHRFKETWGANMVIIRAALQKE